LINAASKVGDASHDIMYHVEPDSELDSAYKVKLPSVGDVLVV